MAVQAPPRTRTGGQEVSPTDFARLQDDVQDLQQVIVDNPLIDGQLLQDVTLTGGANTNVPHKLGRAYRGWFVTKKTVTADYPSDVTASGDTARFITLTKVNTETVDLFVF